MILGIDAGGTNVDVVILDGGRIVGKEKVPNVGIRKSVDAALNSLRDDWSPVDVDRVVVATTIVLNATIQDRLPACTALLVPGPGLDPRLAFASETNEVLAGCVDHRGRVTESVDYNREPTTPVVAVVSKFATRNPALEREVRTNLPHDDDHVALGNEAGAALSFPQRAATTVANAKTSPTFVEFQTDLTDALSEAGIDSPVSYLKGDGAMLGEPTMRRAPAQTLRCGPAASTLGLLALTDTSDAVCVDIGGTTTDVARVTDGFPDVTEISGQDTIEPAYSGVVAQSIPIGGDTVIEQGTDGVRFTEQREGNASAFGGEKPTLTDALHVTGAFEDGDTETAYDAFRPITDDCGATARWCIEQYVDRVTAVIDSLNTADVTELIVGGVLAPYLADRLCEQSADIGTVAVPSGADVAGAIGCAVARVSLEVQVHIDTPRGVMTVASVGPEIVEEIEEGRTYSDEEITRIATTKAREATTDSGGDSETECEILTRNRFNVVQHRRVVGEIVDVRARTVPGFELVEGGLS